MDAIIDQKARHRKIGAPVTKRVAVIAVIIQMLIFSGIPNI
jgi:hypothetical protein